MTWFSLEAFVPLLLIGNVLPVLPIFVSQTEELDKHAQRRLATQCLLAGGAVAAVLIVGGPLLFKVLGITIYDLAIAGGLILFVFTVYDLLFSRHRRKSRAVRSAQEEQQDEGDAPGVVPLGIPIMVGPAVLTACLTLSKLYGIVPTLIAMAVNVAINWVILFFGGRLNSWLGPGVMRVVSSVMALMLSAIAISMVRHGLTGIIGGLS